jgi:hypothetical protein
LQSSSALLTSRKCCCFTAIQALRVSQAVHASRPVGPSRTSWPVHTTSVCPSPSRTPELLWIFESTWPFFLCLLPQ